MQMIKYTTGRQYDGAQTLVITAPPTPADDLADVDVSFTDASRRIAGVVTLLAFELQNADAIGAAVLREYDAGRYTLT